MRGGGAILRLAMGLGGWLVPLGRRAEWVREWRAELWHRFESGRGRNGEEASCLSLAHGILADALWLRTDWLQGWARASAFTCLWVLAAYSALCVLVAWVAEGSWRAFVGLLLARFLGGFAFVAGPAIFAALVTYPQRPLRRQVGWRLSARMRWNLFLGAKVVLTLLLGFLVTVVATEPARALAGARMAWLADWVELILSALVVTASLRWAMLDQEQRCQRCLRLLSQPTRVGPPSRNFLEWSGTALACEDGHGLLRVPEMEGSWCWFDLWVDFEFDSGLTGLFAKTL